MQLKQYFKKYITVKQVLLTVAVSVVMAFVLSNLLVSKVVIKCDGKEIKTNTIRRTVKGVLKQKNIAVGEFDYISAPLHQKLHACNITEIKIKRAVPVTVNTEGKDIKLMTYRDTVEEAVKHSSIKLWQEDKFAGVDRNTKIVPGMKINLIRVKEEVFTEKTTIPYKTILRENNNLEKGIQKVIQQGKNGIREKSFKVVLENGKETVKKVLSDTMLSHPLDAIIECGTILTKNTARGGIIRYKKVMDMRATAYTSSFEDTGKNPWDPGFGITFTGTRAKRGTIAVDPRVIPLGSRVYVECAGSTPDYGYAVAADTGGAIKGNLIDLYFDDSSTVNMWGCRRVKVYFIKD